MPCRNKPNFIKEAKRRAQRVRKSVVRANAEYDRIHGGARVITLEGERPAPEPPPERVVRHYYVVKGSRRWPISASGAKVAREMGETVVCVESHL